MSLGSDLYPRQTEGRSYSSANRVPASPCGIGERLSPR